MESLEGLDRQNIEVVESFARDGGAEPMFYDADLEVFDQEEEPLKVSPYMLKSFQFIKDKTTGLYGCQFCGYRSMHRSSIKSHLAVHSSARPFACGMCSYEAKRLNDLRKHWLIKHGKRLATRSRGYRHRAMPPMGGNALSVSLAGAARGMNSKNAQGNAHGRNDMALSISSSSTSDGDTKWPPSTGMAFPGMPIYPETVGSLRNVVAVSPHSEDADMELIDADEEDFDNNHLDILSRSGDDEQIIVKTEPQDDEYLSMSNKEKMSKNITDELFKNSDENVTGQSCIETEIYKCETNKEFADESNQSTSATSQSPNATSQLLNIASQLSSSNAQALNLTTVSPNSTMSKLKPSQAIGQANTPSSQSISPQSNLLSPSSMLQIKNIIGNAMPTPSNPASTPPGPMAHSSSSDTKQGKKHFAFDYSSMNVMKNPSARLRSTWSTDSLNSTTVTSSAANQRHACVGTSRGWMCNHCQIQFFDNAIYFMHMGLHDQDDPWKCTVCEKQLYDVYSFTSHFVNGHSSAS